MKTGVNFKRCNVGTAELHNSRDKAYMLAVNSSPNKWYSIFEDQTRFNSSWRNPAYKDKRLPELLDELRALYREKVGQAPQENDRVRIVTDKKTGMKKTVTTHGWSPIREGVCPIKPDTKIEDFQPFIEWLESKGPKVICLDLHQDEGHTDLLSGERIYNRHTHITVDWVNHETGKTFKLSNADCVEMQTRLAEALRMERGESKELTGAENLTAREQRAKAQAEEIKKLELLAVENEQSIYASVDANHAVARQTVKQFDALSVFVEPTKAEQDTRNNLESEISRDLKEMNLQDIIEHNRDITKATRKLFQIIQRRAEKVSAIAKDIPFWKKPRLAHEAELQARADEAETKAKRIESETLNARKTAENAQRKANEILANLDKRLKQAKDEGLLEGINIGKEREQKALKNQEEELQNNKNYIEDLLSNIKTLTEQRDLANRAVGDKLQIFKELISKFGAQPFEEAGLKFTQTKSWNQIKLQVRNSIQQKR